MMPSFWTITSLRDTRYLSSSGMLSVQPSAMPREMIEILCTGSVCGSAFMSRAWPVSCFFFQAEDGIRVRDVTGVQTCALPISEDARAGRPEPIKRFRAWGVSGPSTLGRHHGDAGRYTGHKLPARGGLGAVTRDLEQFEIGRASCRERV